VTHLSNGPCATFFVFPYFDVIRDLLLNRQTATWNHHVYTEYMYNLNEKNSYQLPFR